MSEPDTRRIPLRELDGDVFKRGLNVASYCVISRSPSKDSFHWLFYASSLQLPPEELTDIYRISCPEKCLFTAEDFQFPF
jgi:hypothetical protein